MIHLTIQRHNSFSAVLFIYGIHGLPGEPESPECPEHVEMFWYRIWYHVKNLNVLKPRSFKTETSPKIPRIWTKLNSKLFLTPNVVRYWIGYFFFQKQIQISFVNIFFFDTEAETTKNRKVAKPKRHTLDILGLFVFLDYFITIFFTQIFFSSVNMSIILS